MKPHIQQTIADIRAAQQRLNELVAFLEDFGGASPHNSAPAAPPAASDAAASPQTPTKTPAARLPRSIQRARPASSANVPKTRGRLQAGSLTQLACAVIAGGPGPWTVATVKEQLLKRHPDQADAVNKRLTATLCKAATAGILIKADGPDGAKVYRQGKRFSVTGAPLSEKEAAYADFRRSVAQAQEGE